MDVARPTFLGKGNHNLSAVVGKTSCNSGWLRLVVQGIFATITVASFILIVIMAVKNPNASPVLRPAVPPRCSIHGCRVVCTDAPYFEDYEDHVIFSVSEADTKCLRVTLELHTPSFVNNTLPENWLSRMRSNVHHLTISGGNLMYFPSGAFLTQFSGHIKILVLQSLNIKMIDSISLVGLSSLRTFNILNSRIDCRHENALRAVDDTLETLTITHSGVWDPVTFTGSRGLERLTIVDFSYNDFGDILGEQSFYGLKVTEILYLNSCRITAIGAGAFDYLTSIKVLYLNNNMLITVPSGLFINIVSLENPRPRINLQDNYWLCNCSINDLRELVRKEVLLVEATCTYPDEMLSISFTQFEYICNNDTAGTFLDMSVISDKQVTENLFNPDPVYVNGSYCSGRIGSKTARFISPVQNNKCSSKKFKNLNISTLVDRIKEHPFKNKSRWMRFSYFLKTELYSIVQIGATENQQGYGILWYQSTCPHELYCLDVIPSFLRVINIDSNARYTFCPINLESANLETEYCLGHDFFEYEDEKKTHYRNEPAFHVMLYLTTMFVCLCFGAVVVYGLIRIKPTLLRGSKRILFVKHKNVDALVLPPKVPLRNDLTAKAVDLKGKKLFNLSTDHTLKPPNLDRMKSVRSDKSGSPSYISAMQPSDDQLAEWRIRHHFNNDLTINSKKSELSTLSWIYGESYNYYSLDDNDGTYESLK